MRIFLLAWLGVALPGFGQSVTLPERVTGQPGQFLEVKATTDCTHVRWFTPQQDDSTLSLFPTHLLKDSRVAVVLALRPGEYTLFAYTAKGDVPSPVAKCVVHIEGRQPEPPIPPTPPEPTDELQRALQAIYDRETAQDKQERLQTLASLYEEYGKIVRDPSLQTAGDLFVVLQGASKRLLPADSLRPMRERLRQELERTLPTTPETKFNERLRQEAQGLFSHLADVLRRIR